MNTTLIQYHIKKHKKIAKWLEKQGFINEANHHREKQEEFQDCYNVVTGNVVGYLKSKD